MTIVLPTTLLLVRHGHVTDNTPGAGARLCGWTDPPLSPLGLRPRWRAARREIGCGELDGWIVEDVRQHFPTLWAANTRQEDAGFRWPGSESYRALRRRVLRALRGIAGAHPGRRVLVVTHAGAITQVLGALAGTSPAPWEAFRAGNASITELRWHAGGGALVRFDGRGHLAGVAGDPEAPLPA